MAWQGGVPSNIGVMIGCVQSLKGVEKMLKCIIGSPETGKTLLFAEIFNSVLFIFVLCPVIKV